MSTRRPDGLVYYFDANLDSPPLIARLVAAGMPCEAHRDHFRGDAEDAVWIPQIAACGWVIVTRDFAIQRRPAERAAWTATRATVLMLRGESLSADSMGEMLLAAHRGGRLDNAIAKRDPPMILYLHSGGQFHVHFGGARRGGKKQ